MMKQTKKRNKSKTKYNIEDSGLDSLRIQRIESSIYNNKAKISDLKTEVLSSMISPDDYLVSVKVDLLTEQREDWGFAHSISLIYKACVRIIDSIDEDTLHNVLSKTVPSFLYDRIVSIIYETTGAVGCKLTSLSEKRFMKSIKNMGIKESVN